MAQKLERIIVTPKDALCVCFFNQGRPSVQMHRDLPCSEKQSEWVLLLQTYREQFGWLPSHQQQLLRQQPSLQQPSLKQPWPLPVLLLTFHQQLLFRQQPSLQQPSLKQPWPLPRPLLRQPPLKFHNQVSCIVSILQNGALLSRQYSESHLNAIDRASENWLAS